MYHNTLQQFADQFGLIAHGEVVPAHVSRSSWSRAVHRGYLSILQPGIGAVTNTQQSPEQRIAAAVRASGKDAMAGGATAAWLHGVSLPFIEPIHILSPTRPLHRKLVGAVVHRPIDTYDLSPIDTQGIPSTSPFRTLLDTCAWNPALAHRVLEHFLVADQFTIQSAWRQLFLHAKQGRPGITQLKNLLNKWDLDTAQPESVLEAKMLSLCFMNKLPPFEFQAQVGNYRVDFLWRQYRAIVECDGFTYHGSTRDAFENDRLRDAELQSLGYTVWRFSFRQIAFEPKLVASHLERGFSAQNVAKNETYGAENTQGGGGICR